MVVFSPNKPNPHDTQALTEVWAIIDGYSCPHNYNFHMHTTCSDGRLSPFALMHQAVNIGLKGMAITDHHSVQGYQIAQNFLEEMKNHVPDYSFPHLWTGIEITSLLLNTDVHILGYGFDPQHPSMRCYLGGTSPMGKEADAGNVINALHQAGGLVVLAHPYRYRQSPQELIPAAVELGIDGVEAYYAYGNPQPWTPTPKETQKTLELSQRFGLFTTCGTDTHGTNLLRRL